MAIELCRNCRGNGCLKCRDGFVDIPYKKTVPPKPMVKQAKLSSASLQTMKTNPRR